MLATVLLAGCVSWTQAEPPPRDRWHETTHECDPDSNAPVGAGFIAVTSGGISTAMFVSSDDIENRSWGLIFGVIGVAYALDALNALGDRSECRRYRAQLGRLKPIDLD